MNSDQLRRLQSKLSVAFLAAVALALASCGGGGATSSPTSVGSIQLLPGSATIYAGVPYTANIVGGRKPYLVTSSEPTIIELNFTSDSGQFSFVARNPGVVDSGLTPEELPVRSVNIEVRDSNGAASTNTYKVAQNFFTGYGQSYSNTCASAGTSGPPQACSGTDTIISFAPTVNGGHYGNRVYQFDRVRGDYSFVVEDPAVTPQLVSQIRVSTDLQGKAFVRTRVNASASTQIASYKVTDVATGTTSDALFTIVQQAPADPPTLLPTTLTFTGSLTTRCGTGTADVFVFGGTPPYSLTYSAGLGVSPTTVAASGDKFSVTAGLTSPPCPAGTSVIVADSRGALATLAVTIAPGTGTLPTLTASPASVTLTCGTSGSATVVGGTGSGYTANSSHPRVTASISGSTVSMTRANGDGLTVYPVAGTVSVTDGTSVVAITVAVPANCP
ncbi:MAG: hypothetical protein IPP91_08440 [Betaproteobacteria bacterium]|nr:hypothetical protein [Betaproteobacteria bacterium]